MIRGPGKCLCQEQDLWMFFLYLRYGPFPKVDGLCVGIIYTEYIYPILYPILQHTFQLFP